MSDSQQVAMLKNLVSEARQRAEAAEARIAAVREVCDEARRHGIRTFDVVRAALDGEATDE